MNKLTKSLAHLESRANKHLNSDELSLHWSVEQWDTSLLGWAVTHEIIEVARVPAAVAFHACAK